jgi:hypothetical protein
MAQTFYGGSLAARDAMLVNDFERLCADSTRMKLPFTCAIQAKGDGCCQEAKK